MIFLSSMLKDGGSISRRVWNSLAGLSPKDRPFERTLYCIMLMKSHDVGLIHTSLAIDKLCFSKNRK